MKNRIRCSPGFTLVEIIVAVALVGIIAVGLFTGIHFAVQTWPAAMTICSKIINSERTG